MQNALVGEVSIHRLVVPLGSDAPKRTRADQAFAGFCVGVNRRWSLHAPIAPPSGTRVAHVAPALQRIAASLQMSPDGGPKRHRRTLHRFQRLAFDGAHRASIGWRRRGKTAQENSADESKTAALRISRICCPIPGPDRPRDPFDQRSSHRGHGNLEGFPARRRAAVTKAVRPERVLSSVIRE